MSDAQMPERIWAFKCNCGDVYTCEWALTEEEAKEYRSYSDQTAYIRADLCASGQQVRAGNPKMAQSALERLTELRGEVTDEPLEKSGRYFNGNSFGDLTRCTHGDTGYFQNRADGEAIAILWGLWRNGALTPTPEAAHRSFPDAADGRPLPPMADALMTAGLSGEDARFVAIQLAQNGLMLVPAPETVCRKCGGIMQPGIAMGQTVTSGAPDDLGGDVQTMSVGGPGAVIPCSKCADCGWSVTAPEAAQAEAVPVGETGTMPGSNGAWSLAVFRADDVPVGTKLYTAPPAPPAPGIAEAVERAKTVLICAQEMCRAGHPVSALNVATDALRALEDRA